MNENISLVQIEHRTYEEAFTAAAQDAATTMATIAPAIVYQQGHRDFVTTAFPLRYVADRVIIDNLTRGGDPSEHHNRPIIPEHSRAITEYLVTQDGTFSRHLRCVSKNLCAATRLRALQR